MKMLIALTALSLSTFASGQVLVRASPNMGLNVSLKMADSQPAFDFVVIQPSGEKSTATAQPINNGDRSGAVYYPFDFTNAGKHLGTYRWTATANGKEVASGSFEYKKSPDGFLLYSSY